MFLLLRQPQGIAPTSEYFLDIKNIVVGAILYGCPEYLFFKEKLKPQILRVRPVANLKN
ncbi:MAG: hypothetical protein KAI83_18410 [Thiomargarita sp.]|nr:hypothetical protein [Thiomargarita sp.]